MSMNYKTLKRLISRSAERTGKRNVDFKIDIDNLNNELTELELVCLPYGADARRIDIKDIPLVSEYFRDDKMTWVSGEKYITSLVFIDSNKIDDNLLELIELLKTKPEDDPDIDHVAILSEIIGAYPCYFALVMSYQNNSPNSVGKNSYFIACRANKVIIKDPDYVYTPAHPIPDPKNVPDSVPTTDKSSSNDDADDTIEEAEYDDEDIKE